MIEASKFFNRASVNLDKLPPGVNFTGGESSRISYDAKERLLVYNGVLGDDERSGLMKLSEDQDYRGAIDTLFRRARNSRHQTVLEVKKRVRVLHTDGRNYILGTHNV